MTERAERALANMRFSDFGRRTGLRLPIPMDYSQRYNELIIQVVQIAMTLRQVIDAHDGALPKGTLCIIGANVLVFLKRDGVAFADVCLNPYAVLHLNQVDRLVKSAFVHRDLFHLLANMTGVLQDGAFLESQDGTATFLARTAVLLGLSQGMLVALSHSERRLAGYG
eukprot:CAMPEP_0198694906 /NCGR_PEP_ID=MMETSP1468-20131203/278385_1 /TAXON_ID=1461545 /ORGANISM="Mantoniella sp, Strain CCMP1436" /LENGTH=167 /DNA_ID=CAMNT_0044450369 /DNA_START=35 /DNA_END=534 /DNA_ORIENTATION=-